MKPCGDVAAATAPPRSKQATGGASAGWRAGCPAGEVWGGAVRAGNGVEWGSGERRCGACARQGFSELLPEPSRSGEKLPRFSRCSPGPCVRGVDG